MARIERAQGVGGVGIANAEVTFYLDDENPTYETDDSKVLDLLAGNENFTVTGSQPVQDDQPAPDPDPQPYGVTV